MPKCIDSLVEHLEAPSDRYFGTWLTLFDDFSDFVESGGLELAATACAHFLPALDWVSDPRTGDVLVNDVRRYEGFHAAGIDAALTFTNWTRATAGPSTRARAAARVVLRPLHATGRGRRRARLRRGRARV